MLAISSESKRYVCTVKRSLRIVAQVRHQVTEDKATQDVSGEQMKNSL